MASSIAYHAAINGGHVRLSCDGAELTGPATSVVAVALGRRRNEFTSGPLDAGETFARISSGVELTESYSLQGGRLRIGVRAHLDQMNGITDVVRVGVWEGQAWSIYVAMYGGAQSSDVIALFNAVTIAETPTGATITPKEHSGVAFAEDPVVIKLVSGLGLLEIAPLTKDVARGLPRWNGAPVGGGELFVEDRGTPRMHFVLVASTAKTLVMPDPDVGTTDLMNRLEGLRADWLDAD
jgi:hypothetical protein